jgi:hypothetical protein
MREEVQHESEANPFVVKSRRNNLSLVGVGIGVPVFYTKAKVSSGFLCAFLNRHRFIMRRGKFRILGSQTCSLVLSFCFDRHVL